MGLRPPVLDLQLNGYKGVDFNADGVSADDLRRACLAFRAYGGDRMLATVITDDLARMAARIGRLAAAHRDDEVVRDVMAGIHVEGPFINPEPGFVGAHPARHVQPATVSAAETLVAAGAGLVRLVTLAPECDAGLATTRFLSESGIVVSAGHCDPSADVLIEAIDAGLRMFTHVGNGCPLLLHRHDNVIQRVLAADGLPWVMVIPDGVHLPIPLLRTILKVVGLDRLVAVTDATAAGGMGPGRYTLGGREVVVGEDGAAWSADRSHLVGSTASPAVVRRVLHEQLGLSTVDVDRLTVANPARAIGLS